MQIKFGNNKIIMSRKSGKSIYSHDKSNQLHILYHSLIFINNFCQRFFRFFILPN